MNSGKGKYQKDWTCPECNYNNHAYRGNCRECLNAYVQPNVEYGDWWCRDKECGTLNFGTRTRCFKCKKTK